MWSHVPINMCAVEHCWFLWQEFYQVLNRQSASQTNRYSQSTRLSKCWTGHGCWKQFSKNRALLRTMLVAIRDGQSIFVSGIRCLWVLFHRLFELSWFYVIFNSTGLLRLRKADPCQEEKWFLMEIFTFSLFVKLTFLSSFPPCSAEGVGGWWEEDKRWH